MLRRLGIGAVLAALLVCVLVRPAPALAESYQASRAMVRLEDASDGGEFLLCGEGRRTTVDVVPDGTDFVLDRYGYDVVRDRRTVTVDGFYYGGECRFVGGTYDEAGMKSFCDSVFDGVTAVHVVYPELVGGRPTSMAANRGWVRLSDVCYVKTEGAAAAVFAGVVLAVAAACVALCRFGWRGVGRDGGGTGRDRLVRLSMVSGSVVAVALAWATVAMVVPSGSGPYMEARHAFGWHRSAADVLGLEEGRTYVVPDAGPVSPPDIKYDPSAEQPYEPEQPSGYEPPYTDPWSSWENRPVQGDDPEKFVIRPEEG